MLHRQAVRCALLLWQSPSAPWHSDAAAPALLPSPPFLPVMARAWRSSRTTNSRHFRSLSCLCHLSSCSFSSRFIAASTEFRRCSVRVPPSLAEEGSLLEASDEEKPLALLHLRWRMRHWSRGASRGTMLLVEEGGAEERASAQHSVPSSSGIAGGAAFPPSSQLLPGDSPARVGLCPLAPSGACRLPRGRSPSPSLRPTEASQVALERSSCTGAAEVGGTEGETALVMENAGRKGG